MAPKGRPSEKSTLDGSGPPAEPNGWKQRARRFRLRLFIMAVFAILASHAGAQTYVLAPERVFDGTQMRAGWRVRIEEGRIAEAGPAVSIKGAHLIELAGATLTPALIDTHTHVLLHPYDETSWNDQVLKETTAERVTRATNHLRASLMAGFTTLRDLGSEGAGYADAGLKEALAKGVIAGPRLIIVTGLTIVATGSYGPKGFHEGVTVPLGAIEADGHDTLIAEVRRQIGGGADCDKSLPSLIVNTPIPLQMFSHGFSSLRALAFP